ncbi:MAG: hypothetical protein HSCHL_0038 [Hydrogenibacillus schlegelii]|uniref:Uncharacterized protein n=1 Tax=Hydrogenibacillus schlegelii TaxID=1484 RepID=A0A2T5G9B6_HYDSH|nr:MAG: hypothetical protein HSCHL_0038 [Hydrogenibacillus schlegelii]
MPAGPFGRQGMGRFWTAGAAVKRIGGPFGSVRRPAGARGG